METYTHGMQRRWIVSYETIWQATHNSNSCGSHSGRTQSIWNRMVLMTKGTKGHTIVNTVCRNIQSMYEPAGIVLWLTHIPHQLLSFPATAAPDVKQQWPVSSCLPVVCGRNTHTDHFSRTPHSSVRPEVTKSQWLERVWNSFCLILWLKPRLFNKSFHCWVYSNDLCFQWKKWTVRPLDYPK